MREVSSTRSCAKHDSWCACGAPPFELGQVPAECHSWRKGYDSLGAEFGSATCDIHRQKSSYADWCVTYMHMVQHSEMLNIQGILEIKDTHRPWEGPMLLGIYLP